MKSSDDINFILSCQDILNTTRNFAYIDSTEIICENIFFKLSDILGGNDNRVVMLDAKNNNYYIFVDKDLNIYTKKFSVKKLNKLITEKGFFIK